MIKTFYKTEDGKEFDDIREAQVHEYHQIIKKNDTPQELMFELMKLGSFNGFNGERVVEKLKERRDLWKACLMDSGGDYYTIRDLPTIWHVDTLLIRPVEGKEDELLKWAKKNLYPDEIDWKKLQVDYRGEPIEPKQLQLWWD
jgi:hypothetical protein